MPTAVVFRYCMQHCSTSWCLVNIYYLLLWPLFSPGIDINGKLNVLIWPVSLQFNTSLTFPHSNFSSWKKNRNLKKSFWKETVSDLIYTSTLICAQWVPSESVQFFGYIEKTVPEKGSTLYIITELFIVCSGMWKERTLSYRYIAHLK